MKKVFSILLLLALAFGIVACNNDPEDPTDPTDPTDEKTASISGASDITIDFGVVFDPYSGVSATDSVDGAIAKDDIEVTGAVDTSSPGTYTLTYKVTGSDGQEVTVTRRVTVRTESGETPQPTEIVIMHGAPYEVDPFHNDFSGTEQQARQAKQREVEDRLNVKVVYKAYPASAAWGPSRVTAIINASVAGSPLADIYWTTSDWIQQLADGNAIIPVDDYMATHGANIHQDFRTIGTYDEKIYGFAANNLTVDVGLYYNADLVANLGVDNPSQLFLDGEWTWSKFESWATEVQTAVTALGEDYYALGGVPSAYAESMVPLNGGRLINVQTGRVAFAQTPALDTYTFLSDLWSKGLFEPGGQYDAGSPLWQTGKVALHPGSLWFINADNRWGNLQFELGFVPYPSNDTYTGDYASPVSGVAIYNIASGMTPERESLVFQVWNELQLWKTEQELKDEFELTLLTRFDEEIYVEAYLEIYDKIYLELINAIGISAYGENGWRTNVNAGIREGTARTNMDRIAPIYAAALDEYLN